MIIVFASGQGSNFKALVDHFGKNVRQLVCDKPNAGCLQVAKAHNIAYATIDRAEYCSRNTYETAVLDALHKDCRVIVLAGFMRILSEYFLDQLTKRLPLAKIINLHPAHLDEYKGPNAYAFAIDHKFPRWGISVHHVTAQVDTGELIAQTELPLFPYENATTFAKKAKSAEHKILIQAVEQILQGAANHSPLANQITDPRKDKIVTEKYGSAGVSIAAGERLVELIKKDNPHIGGFAGLYPYGDNGFLVACTDGVGTKLELSIAMQRYEDLGQDLVAMSVNDLVVCGATPLFFLDYFACGKLDVTVTHRVIQGIQKACQQTGCILLGGETAEMPGFYHEKKFDLAGFAVGEVKKKDLIDGTSITKGDVIVGLPSSGFHANGFSLVRKILADNNLSLGMEFDGSTLGDLLTAPTRLYVNSVKAALSKVHIKGMAHITGGGLTNIQRILPKKLTYRINHSAIPTPNLFRQFQKWGEISQEEAYTVWNMGMGFVLVVSPEAVELLCQILPDAFIAGEIDLSP